MNSPRARRGTVVPEYPSGTAEYQRLYRVRRPEYATRNRLKADARTAAALQVAKNHPDEFATAIAAEEHKRGL